LLTMIVRRVDNTGGITPKYLNKRRTSFIAH